MSKQDELREVLRRDAKMDISVQTDAVILLDLLEAALAEARAEARAEGAREAWEDARHMAVGHGNDEAFIAEYMDSKIEELKGK